MKQYASYMFYRGYFYCCHTEKVHESTTSNVVSSCAGVQYMSAPSSSHPKRPEVGDEPRQRAGLGTEGAGFCQMIM